MGLLPPLSADLWAVAQASRIFNETPGAGIFNDHWPGAVKISISRDAIFTSTTTNSFHRGEIPNIVPLYYL